MNRVTQPTTPEQARNAVQLTRLILNDGISQLPHDISERLRVARQQALTQQVRTKKTAPYQKNILLTWLHRMPYLTKGLIALPTFAVALIIANKVHTPINQPVDLALNNSLKHTSVALMDNASAPIDIDAILNEQIPLQAYLNDEFNHYLANNVHATQTPTELLKK